MKSSPAIPLRRRSLCIACISGQGVRPRISSPSPAVTQPPQSELGEARRRRKRGGAEFGRLGRGARFSEAPVPVRMHVRAPHGRAAFGLGRSRAAGRARLADSLLLLADSDGRFAAGGEVLLWGWMLLARCCGRRTSGGRSAGPTPGRSPSRALPSEGCRFFVRPGAVMRLGPGGRRRVLWMHTHSGPPPSPGLGGGAVTSGRVCSCTTTRLSRAHRGRARWGQAAGRYVLFAGDRARPARVRAGSVLEAAVTRRSRSRVSASGRAQWSRPALRPGRLGTGGWRRCCWSGQSESWPGRSLIVGWASESVHAGYHAGGFSGHDPVAVHALGAQ